MDFETGPAIGTGILAGLIMIVPVYMGIIMMPSQMKMDILKLLGTVMLPVSGMTYAAGLMLHLVMSIVFASIHIGLFVAFDIDSNLAAWGLLFGLIHSLVSGTALGMMPSMHRGIRDGTVEAPGVMASAYPTATVMGFVMVHLLYGVLIGTFYEAFA